MIFCRPVLLFAVAAAFAPAYGQSGAPKFAVTYNFADGNLRPLNNGTTITFPAVDVNATATAIIIVANTGTAAGTVTGVAINGDGFQLSGLPLLPQTLNANQAVRFGIAFTPPRIGSFSGSFRIDLGDQSISGLLAGSTAHSNLSLSYLDPRTNNVVPLPNGATLQFPDTPVGTPSTITLQVPNTGPGTGQITSIALGDDAAGSFDLVSVPMLPVSLPPSLQLRFAVRFNALQPQTATTTLSLNLDGNILTINIAARATGPQFQYTNGADGLSVSAGGTLALPSTSVGQTSSVTVTILNAGTGNGQINGISASGQGFTVSDLPLFPLILKPNQSQQFTLNFAPTQAGTLSGRLVIGNELILLSGSGIGPRPTYSYTNSGVSTTVAESGTVFLPPTPVGGAQKLDFTVSNDGTASANLASITVTGPGTTFALQDVPGLPFSLAPGNRVTFSILFTPSTTGGLTGTLRVNTSSFTLSGTGSEPAALPAYQLTTSAATPQAGTQPTVSLALASPYPMAIQGTLALTFVSDVFTDDPAVQFASGGRTVKFTIPANSTQALFNGVSAAMPLQTGTTAGSIVLTPAFALQGGYSITPPSPATLTIAVPRSAPQLLSGAITNQTLTTFTLTLTGFSTTRSLRQLDIQVTAQPGENISTGHLTLDVASAASSWFQGTAAQQSGGSFQISIPFVLQNGSGTDDLVHRLQALSITATNETGASIPLVVPVT